MDGTPFGRYQLIELLGRGGMGEVWRAFDTATERVVAVKLLPATFVDDKVFQERFRREARAAAGLDEPHVVPIHDFGEIEGRLYVSMRMIQGHDLQALLENGPLEPARAVEIITQIASALDSAHRINLVHRDVKPSNILVAEDDFAYLIDFGIAQAAGDTKVTSTGAIIGTWAYMAPERFKTGTADSRSDIYALSCVLHQALTAQLPFPDTSYEQVIAAHLFEPPPRPSTMCQGVAPEMDDVIATGMAKDPGQRYATAKNLALAARKAVASPVSPLKPATAHQGQTISRPVDQILIKQPNMPPTVAPGSKEGTEHHPRPVDGNSMRRNHRRRPLVVAMSLVIAALAAVAVLGTMWFTRKKSPNVSQENLIRQTIQEFDSAIQRGDLATLRSITCGATRDSYLNYPDDQWRITYPKVAAAKQYPVVASIDQVVVSNGKHAEANVTSFIAYAPQVRSTRSFDLQFVDGSWKICEGPAGIPE